MASAISSQAGSARRLAEFYDANVEEYDQRHSGPWWAATRRWEARAVRRLEPPILDVGCGTGYWQRWLARRWREPVIGVDPSIEMLRRNRAGPCLQAPAEALPFPDSSFRGVSCMLTVLNTETAGAALRDIARVLEPGGRCAVSIASIWDNNGKPWKRVSVNGAQVAFRLYTRQEFESLAEVAGLRVIAFDSLFRRLRTSWVNAPMTASQRAALRSERSLPAEQGQLYSFVFEKSQGRARRAARSGSRA